MLILNQAIQKVTKYAYQIQYSIESNNVISTLEKSSCLLEELCDSNHGLHHREGAGVRNTGGSSVINNSILKYPGGAGGVPLLDNYGDQPYCPQNNSYGNTTQGGCNNGWIIPLTSNKYYELHICAMDEMPILEE